MRYMKKTLLLTAFPWKDIAGNELDWRRRLFMQDFTSFRVGPVRVRQVRMPSRGEPSPVFNSVSLVVGIFQSWKTLDFTLWPIQIVL